MSRAPAILFFCILALFSLDSYAQSDHMAPSIEFIENQGQWDEKIQFESNIPDGLLYIESGKLTFVFQSSEDIRRMHDLKHKKTGTATKEDQIIDGHLYQVSFLNSNKMTFSGKKKRSNYYNYFLGNDQTRWAGKVPAYGEALR